MVSILVLKILGGITNYKIPLYNYDTYLFTT